MKHSKNIIVGLIFVLIFIIATVATWIYSQVDSALPKLEGKQTIFGLSASAIVERDENGIATIKAKKPFRYCSRNRLYTCPRAFFSNGFTTSKFCPVN